MIFEINAYPENWKQKIWIASKIGEHEDEEDNKYIDYGEPQEFNFNIQSISSDADISEFGEKISEMKKVIVPISYKNRFKAFDVAYLDGVTPNGETNYGDNANYRLLPPRNGNAVIIIYFEKIIGK